ncbi:YfhO family protein [bacterium]|nr:YfhO family protein [bacterium]
MAKARSSGRKSTRKSAPQGPSLAQPGFLEKHAHAVFLGMIALLLIIFFHEAFFEGKVFAVPDNIASIVQEQGYLEKAKENGINAFWNPYVFAGMPTWGSSSPGHGMYLHTFLDPLKPMLILQAYGWVQSIVNILPLPSMFWDLFNFFLLGLFTYMLGVRRKFEPWVAFLAAVSVVFTLYSLNWVMAGHNTKITVFAWLPAILLLVDMLFEKRSILRVALLIVTLHFTFNSGHVQMVVYSLMAVAFYVMYKWYAGAKFKDVALVSVITLGAAAFAFLMLSGPYFATWEYKDFSIRGAGSGGSGHGAPGGGLDYDYATKWSFSPLEVLTFFVPSFVGFGTPTYWGSMPFTESPIYLGVVISFFALLGILLRPKDRFVHLWIALGVFALLVSFGRNFGLIYDLLFNNLPFFNSFRIPSMILFLEGLCMSMLAGVGLTEIVRIVRERRKGDEGAAQTKRLTKVIWVPVAVAGALVLLLMASEGGFETMIAEGMQQNHPQMYSALQQVEQAAQAGQLSQLNPEAQGLTRDNIFSMALNDALLALLFMALAAGALYAFVRGKMALMGLQAALLLLLIIDWWIVDYKPMNMVPLRQQEQSLARTDVVDFLQQDTTVFRILPARNHNDNNWYVGFGIQSVAGYHPAKLKLYDDIRNTMYNEFTFQNGQHLDAVNWAMLSMLNTKYLIVPNGQEWQPRSRWLKPVFTGQQETVYQNLFDLDRAFFVGRYEVIPDDAKMLEKVSTLPGYMPDKVAYLSEEPPAGFKEVPDSVLASASVKMVDFGINGFAYDVSTPETAILKISEVYYPSGWTATIDGKPVDILRTDYALRAVVVPAGEHRVEMHFEPETYEAGLIVTTVTNYLLAIVLLFYLVMYIRKRMQAGKAATAGKDSGDK